MRSKSADYIKKKNKKRIRHFRHATMKCSAIWSKKKRVFWPFWTQKGPPFLARFWPNQKHVITLRACAPADQVDPILNRETLTFEGFLWSQVTADPFLTILGANKVLGPPSGRGSASKRGGGFRAKQKHLISP